MNTLSRSGARATSPAGTGAGLTIGELAARTGVAAATLRAWEQRHDFPVPQRLRSGHRRYPVAAVDDVREVVERRDRGIRLDVAIEQVLAGRSPAPGPASVSVYAELRRRHPALASQRLRKSTLIGLSWAIEDEFCARAGRPHLFGAFQRDEFWAPARPRWEELARVARSAHVFADFDVLDAGTTPVRVPLPHDAAMRREWTVVCDSRELPAALTAWELPGQHEVPDADRLFEAIWTVEPRAVRDAARVCAGLVRAADAPSAAPLEFDLADDPVARTVDLATVTTLFNRVVAYVDRVAART